LESLAVFVADPPAPDQRNARAPGAAPAAPWRHEACFQQAPAGRAGGTGGVFVDEVNMGACLIIDRRRWGSLLVESALYDLCCCCARRSRPDSPRI
jgi:hypothetical protein